MKEHQQEKLLGLIYDAAFDPQLWVPVMEKLTLQLSAETACITMLDVFTGGGGGYAALVPEDTMSNYVARWANDNPLHHIGDPLHYIQAWQPTTLRYEEWIDRETLHRSAYYNEFLRPICSENGIMMGLALTGTTTTTMNVARSARHGNFNDEEIAHARRWQAHLVRAVRLGQKVAIAQTSLDTVEHLVNTTPQCLFFLDALGRIRLMSRAAEALLVEGSALYAINDVLAATRSDDERALQKLIAQAREPDFTARRGGTMHLRSSLGLSYELCVSPLGPRAMASWTSEQMMLVTVTVSEAPALPAEWRLRRRFGLTPAETRLALALMEGGTLRDIAEGAGLSINTVRAQLSAVFSKTHSHRQSDLVRTLLALDRNGS